MLNRYNICYMQSLLHTSYIVVIILLPIDNKATIQTYNKIISQV